MRRGSGMHIVVSGASSAQGLGAQGNAYADVLLHWARESNDRRATLANMAYTGFRITDALSLLPFISLQQPDLVIVAHGIAEPILRPHPQAFAFVPRRWRGKGMLD